jgi:hypothetical protein
MLGLTLGDYFVKRCKDGGAMDAWRFTGEAYNGIEDFDFRAQYKTETGQRLETPFARKVATGTQVDGSTHLRWLWGKARAEWN